MSLSHHPRGVASVCKEHELGMVAVQLPGAVMTAMVEVLSRSRAPVS
jgi:hypothetical protein